jgi:hypothetical protein
VVMLHQIKVWTQLETKIKCKQNEERLRNPILVHHEGDAQRQNG